VRGSFVTEWQVYAGNEPICEQTRAAGAIEQVPDEETDAEAADTTLKHSFHLRSDKQVSIELPADLTKIEA
jgi:hypothetical protein